MVLEEGDSAPDFTLPSTDGGEVTLSDKLRTGPVVVLTNRGFWCSYCAEQLQTFSHHAYDLWRNHRTDVLPIVGDPVPTLVEMRDRFDLRVQLLSDDDLEVAPTWSGTEESSTYGEIPIASTFVIDSDGIVRYAQIAENAADRTYANYARHLINNDFERPYGGG